MSRILDEATQDMLATGLEQPCTATKLNQPMASISGYDDNTKYSTYYYTNSPDNQAEARELHAAQDMEAYSGGHTLEAFQKKEHTQFNVPSRRDNIHNGPPDEADSLSEDDFSEDENEMEYDLPAQRRMPCPPIEEEHTQAMREQLLVISSAHDLRTLAAAATREEFN